MNIDKAAQLLFDTYNSEEGIKPLSEQFADLNIDDAYQIQLINVEKKLVSDKITGKKIGLTSKPMQEMFNVNEPDYGHIFASDEVKDNGVLRNKFLQPKVEAEIAFVLKDDLHKEIISEEDVIAATDYVVAAFEVVDSRIKDWKIKLFDTVADNASFGAYQLGTIKMNIKDIDLVKETMKFYKNEELVGEGSGAAVLGNPVTCVAWLANKLAKYNVYLNKGDIVLSGALSAAIVAEQGDEFYAEFSKLGEIKLEFK